MRARIMWRYALAFFLSASFLVMVNLLYVQSAVYRDRNPYHYDPSALQASIGARVAVDAYGGISLRELPDGDASGRGYSAQILDVNLRQAYRSDGLPAWLPTDYTPARLASLYEREEATVFLSDLEIGGRPYTLVTVLDRERVGRTLYTYEPDKLSGAYNPYWLVGMNMLLLTMISYFYTYSITTPVNRMIQRILRLAQGDYARQGTARGVYSQVGTALDALAERLENARRQAELAESAREEWIANLSHDIKTPLTSILGYTELLCDPGYEPGAQERSRYKELILEKGGVIKGLVDELNTLARLKDTAYPLKLERVNLSEEIRGQLISALNSPLLRGSRHAITFSPERETVPALIDRRLFRRALDNLVYNAFIHNDRPVSLRVGLDAGGDGYLSITLDDDGAGVPEQELGRLFDRHYQGARSREAGKGNGLGLPIAKQIIELHGGRIDLGKSPRGGLLIILGIRGIQDETIS